jgi:hypothetical protein
MSASTALGVVRAVAGVLFQELYIVGRLEFIAMIKNEVGSVLEVLRSDSCRVAADACPTMVDAATSTMNSSCVDASTTTAAFEPAFRRPAAQLVLKVGNLRGKDKSLQAAPAVRSTGVGMPQLRMVSRGTQAQTFDDLAARMRKDCEAELTPQLQRAVAAAETAERRIGAQLRDGELARKARDERLARNAAAASADRSEAVAERKAAQSLHDEMASLREVAAVVEAERATAAREIERAREQIAHLQIVENILRGELWATETECASQHALWLAELRVSARQRDTVYVWTSGRGGRGRGRDWPATSES